MPAQILRTLPNKFVLPCSCVLLVSKISRVWNIDAADGDAKRRNFLDLRLGRFQSEWLEAGISGTTPVQLVVVKGNALSLANYSCLN